MTSGMKVSSGRWISGRLSHIGGTRSTLTGSIIAIAGVTCAVAVMLLTLGIALGFKHDIKAKLSGFEAQINITPAYSYMTGRTDSTITCDAALRRTIDSIMPHSSTTLAYRQPAILKTTDDFAAIIIYGYDDAHDTTFERKNIIKGVMPTYIKGTTTDNHIVISSYTASRLHLDIGDKITACFFINRAIKARPMKIAAIYNSGFSEYDHTVAYGSLRMLQKLNKVSENTGNIIEINGLSQKTVSNKAQALQQALIDHAQNLGMPEVPIVDNITHTGAIYLNWLELLDTNVIVIFILMCCVGSLTLISSLFIIILDKIQAIGILRSIGATRRYVDAIFVRICMRLVGWGIIIGNLVGLGFGYVQERWHIIGLDPEMYYLDKVPYTFDWAGILMINVGVAILAWCVLILPAKVAGRISPAKTLRYE